MIQPALFDAADRVLQNSNGVHNNIPYLINWHSLVKSAKSYPQSFDYIRLLCNNVMIVVLFKTNFYIKRRLKLSAEKKQETRDNIFKWLEKKFCPKYCDDILRIVYRILTIPTVAYWLLANYNYYFNAELTAVLDHYDEVYYFLIGSYTVFKNLLRCLERNECQQSGKNGNGNGNGAKGFKFILIWSLSSVGIIFYHPHGINDASHLMFAVTAVVVLTFALNKLIKHFIKNHGLINSNNK